MPHAEVTLPAAASSVPTARHFVESILTGWGMPEVGWTATLIVSELAANAALHARGTDFSVRLTTDGAGVRLEVEDSSMRLPQQRSYSSEATTGRGLRLVSELSDDWGVTPHLTGKTVWVLVRPIDEPGDAVEEVDVDQLLAAYGDVVPISEGRKNGPSVRGHGLSVAA